MKTNVPLNEMMNDRNRNLGLAPRWCGIALAFACMVIAPLALRAADEKPATAAKAAAPTGTAAKDDKPKSSKSKTKGLSQEERDAAAAQRAADAAKRAEEKAKEDARKEAEKKAADEKKAIEEAKKKAEAEAARLEREARLKAEAEEKARLKAEQDKRDAEAAAARAAARALQERADAVVKIKVTRSADEVFRALDQLNRGGIAELAEPDRFLLLVQAGEWEKACGILAQYATDQQSRLYGKLLTDLQAWGSPKPVMLPNDILRLADAAPVELDDKFLTALGKMLPHAIGKGESREELMKVLRKGTAKLGGSDPAKRRAAARLLGTAEFFKEAKEFGLQESEIPNLTAEAKADAPLRLAEDNWDPLVKKLQDPQLVGLARDEALDALHQTLVQSTPQVVQAKLGALLRDTNRGDLIREVTALVGRKTAKGIAETEFDVRRINLELQQTIVRGLPTGAIDAEPGRTFANLYARNWVAESANTLQMYPSWRKASTDGKSKYPHVTIESMLQTAPSGGWLKVLEPQLGAAVRMASARMILLTDRLDPLVPILVDLADTDKATAGQLGNDYLLRWAQLHDPNFTPEAMRQYKLEGHAIVLTRAEQDLSLRQLGTMLGKLDADVRKLLDEPLLVTAFDLCHSKAEVYTRDQIVEVFGPIEKLTPTLVLSLVERMRFKLGSNWRNLTVQRDASTRRNIDDVFKLVNHGYAEAEKTANDWLKAHPDDWRMDSTTGSLLSDWSEFAYFQAVVGDDDKDRFATYLKRTADALAHFRRSAKAYAVKVPKLQRAQFELLPYKAWFYGLLGIAHEGDVNLRKGVTREGLQEIRKAMQDLPSGAGGVHLGLFATMVSDAVKANVIAPEMKYRYLSSAVEITGRGEKVYPAEEKVQYYESLLKEIRLQTTIDGSPKLRADAPFGVFVTLVHTADLARESGGFGKYLQNEVRRTVSGKTIVEQPFYRDKFEEALRLALADFFEIKTILFADPNAGAHDYVPPPGMPQAAIATPKGSLAATWRETPLAYLHLVAKDPTVDRLPPLEIELDFFDRDGKVVIPVPSTPLLVEIAADAPARRPTAAVEVTEIIDSRELAEHKRLKMDVVASARGLLPSLDALLDMKSFGLPVLSVDEREGLLSREFKADADGMYVTSERSWTVELDPTALLQGAKGKIEFQFPKALDADAKVTFRTYKDMDPIEAASLVTLFEGEDVKAIAQPNYRAWAAIGLAAAAVVGGLLYLLLRKKPEVVERKPPFTVPRDCTPFAVVSLLHRIRSSPEANLTENDRLELHREIVTLERAAFAVKTTPQATRDLETLADRWVRTATPH